MAACAYCAMPAFNVIEVRFARAIQPLTGPRLSEDKAPRDVVGRGYRVCDGCLALLDYHVEHHLGPRQQSIYNAMSAVYQLLAVWGFVAVGSLVGFDGRALIQDANFFAFGLVLAFVSLVTWFLRASVHSRYYGDWVMQREGPFKPRNSLAGFSDVRDRLNPELAHYLPVRSQDSIRLASLPGSPSPRSLGPDGEPWAAQPPTNFPGSGVNEWYRLIWISWHLWPLRGVLAPEEWTSPVEPAIKEIEVAVATVMAAGSFAVLVLFVGLPWWLGLLVGAMVWPLGFFVGLMARESWAERREFDIEKQVR